MRAVIARAGAAAVALAMVAALGACTPRPSPMPMLVTLDPAGVSMTVRAPICEGDRIRIAGVLAGTGGHGPAVIHTDVEREDREDRGDWVLVLEVSGASLARGSLTTQVPVDTFDRFGGSAGPSAVEQLFVDTVHRAAGVYMSALDITPGQAVMVFGAEMHDEYSITVVEEPEGRQVIEDWCAGQRT